MDAEKEGRKDNGRHRSVRFDKWIHDEIETIAQKRNLSFTDMVNHLLEYQLNELGFTKALYDAKTFNLKRSGNKTGASKDSKTLELVIHKLDRKRRDQESMLENMEALLTPEQKQQLQKKQGSVTDGMRKKPLQVPSIDKIIDELAEETAEKGEKLA